MQWVVLKITTSIYKEFSFHLRENKPCLLVLRVAKKVTRPFEHNLEAWQVLNWCKRMESNHHPVEQTTDLQSVAT